MWATLMTLGGLVAATQQDPPKLLIETPSFPGMTPALRWRVIRLRGSPEKPLVEVVLESELFDQAVELPGEGPFHVEVVPQGGVPVRLAEKLMVEKGKTVRLRLEDRCGVVRIFGEGLPRPQRLVLTRARDPGPGVRGHQPVQQVSNYRQNMLVPPGTYDLWLVPANGARPQRLAENVRVLAGKVVGVDD
ncbi:MAG: hypothetical protein WHU94_12560 [Thermogemmata sp.]|uniref:Uncharacterized protein n=1 Tax=Thermogemmata fonticola TaxID=2755323 RepID=A0A7V8VCZ9_9BACT|nr:hypothetical protein [Thermogemmata fonticola]MBA2225565.1 hypothetical protein [Thermogemmata fonticola]GIW83618.1 MAG: hypothetical protein KatS3mg106_131 [Gemmataceae bacterium]